MARKIGKRNCLIGKIAGTSWGAKQAVLRTTGLALCYSVAEYCSPVWSRSAHCELVDIKLRETMRVVSGCLKSTPKAWLPVCSAMPPPHLRRKEINQGWLVKIKLTEVETPLKTTFESAPETSRLKSRRPFPRSGQDQFNLQECWRNEWKENTPRGGDIITDPTFRLPGFLTANRKTWVTANRIRTRHGRTSANLHKWGIADSPTCPKCKDAVQDTDHLVLHCPVTKLEGGYVTAHSCEEDLTDWILDHRLEL